MLSLYPFMSRKTIRLLVILSTVSIIAVIVTQIYWVRKAFDLRQREFNQRAVVALQDVAEQLAKLNKVMLHTNPVQTLSSNYYLVNTNSTIEPAVLQHYLQTTFLRYELITDFEVGIYDCTTDRIVYGVSMNTQNTNTTPTSTGDWLKNPSFTYYFGVRFPSETVVSSLQGWVWSSVLVLIAIAFFGYALWVILRQKQLSDIQRDFINNMTHELQTPISTIKIATDVLSKQEIATQPDRLRKYTTIISDEAQRLQNQVEMVLNMAKADKNKLPLTIEWIDIHQIITVLCHKYDGKITLNLQAKEPYVNADRLQVSNLFSNLIDNALKYSPQKPEVVVTSVLEGKKIVISVKDNGIGISPEHQKQVFEKFYRVPTGNIHNVKGFGIGLSYVKQIAKAHQWKITLKSQAGQGSTFSVVIPVHDV
jgi:two-component system, OmpR family, phosphate regulon sensor histidine kinase PhoR